MTAGVHAARTVGLPCTVCGYWYGPASEGTLADGVFVCRDCGGHWSFHLARGGEYLAPARAAYLLGGHAAVRVLALEALARLPIGGPGQGWS